MSETTTSDPASQSADVATSSALPVSKIVSAEPRLRLWPGVLIVAVQWAASSLAQKFAAGTMIQFYAMFMGPMVGAALFTLWWLFASRLPWKERFLALAAAIATGVAAIFLSHPTIKGMPMAVFALPVITLSCAVWLLATAFMRWPIRRAGLLAVLVLGWGYFTLVRLDGVDGSIKPV